MLVVKKIIERNNEPIKYNFDWLVYEHNHDDIVDCKYIGHEFSFFEKLNSHSYDEKEIKWSLKGLGYIEIIELRYRILEKIMGILAPEASAKFKKNYALQVRFHFIDKEGNRIDKHLIL
jgi:hypothetical protein